MVVDKIKYHTFFVLCLHCLILTSCSDYSENLGGGYTYAHEGGGSNYIFHEYPKKGGEIPANVISYDYDKKFIIAKQKPMPCQYAYETAKEYTRRTDTISVRYWLIIKQEQKIFSVLGYDGFLKLKKEYNVPEKLVLK